MIEISFEEFQQLLTRHSVLISQQDPAGRLYHSTYHSQLSGPFLSGKVISTLIRDGITLLMVDYIFEQDTKVYLKTHLPQVGLGFCLKGKIEYSNGKTETFVEYPPVYGSFGAREGFLYATGPATGYQLYPARTGYKALYLHFSYQSFQQLMGELAEHLPGNLPAVLGGKGGYFYEQFKCSPSVMALCGSLFINPFTGRSGQFYTEAKVIELLAHQMDRLVVPRQKISSGPLLTPREEQLMEVCHRLLLERLQDPPSLIELAEHVGMSDYRLKQGFRQKYGLSPFQLVTGQRLLKARQLLLEGSMNVSEVVYAVGYSSIGSFSNSFYEKFGIRPGSLLHG